ncbi:hypothetical protein I8751_06660 [Nostocaceae cyanobacterium CENA357]|uniref:Uncharacterized protein n=1 Tax=Atlanticothrix silvestris CENA357 TaxID=1725252 RepID=A0A8J7HAK4_9CYAN|nr:hypothetical protein [Atlanticothrix silvestris]MBH8552058.1 hypothetical protein [Atlanticothrix silvestris CENA357]
MKQNLAPTQAFTYLDEILVQHSINLLSLNPKKSLITSFAELENFIAAQTTDMQLISHLYSTLEVILDALLQNFPENIFWDFDFMVSSMLRQALLSDDGADFLEYFANKMVSLIELFGIKKEVRFRYIHDFMYGFVWAKWVQKEPHNRAHIEPFSLCFLDYLLIKGQELVHRISLDQVSFYKLCDTGFRNPFSFSREPEDEYRLLTYLAGKQLIPVAAWNWNAHPVWNKPFEEMRQQLSVKLNIQPQRH